MDSQFFLDNLKSGFVCLPVDGINLKNNKVCLIKLFNFLEINTTLSYDEIQEVCDSIRDFLHNSKSFYVGKGSNIAVRL